MEVAHWGLAFEGSAGPWFQSARCFLVHQYVNQPILLVSEQLSKTELKGNELIYLVEEIPKVLVFVVVGIKPGPCTGRQALCSLSHSSRS